MLDDQKRRERDKKRCQREKRSPEKKAQDNEKQALYRKSEDGRVSCIKTNRDHRERKREDKAALKTAMGKKKVS
jgi:hypothetical protein